MKPVEKERFCKAVDKAVSYFKLLTQADKQSIEQCADDYFFVKSERKFCKVRFADVLFVEGLKDYVVIQLENQKIITRMNLKGISALLPSAMFMRVSKSYIVNINHIDAFDNNDIYIGSHEIAIGESFRNEFFDVFVRNSRKM